jgi:hypothetical protein
MANTAIVKCTREQILTGATTLWIAKLLQDEQQSILNVGQSKRKTGLNFMVQSTIYILKLHREHITSVVWQQ